MPGVITETQETLLSDSGKKDKSPTVQSAEETVHTLRQTRPPGMVSLLNSRPSPAHADKAKDKSHTVQSAEETGHAFHQTWPPPGMVSLLNTRPSPSHADGTYQCDICHKKLTSGYRLHTHKMCHRKKDKSRTVQSAEETDHAVRKTQPPPGMVSLLNPRPSPSHADKAKVCPDSSAGPEKRATTQPNSIVVVTHPSGHKVFVCNLCKRWFHTDMELKTHLESHSVKTYPCDICHKKLTSAYRLHTHKMCHRQKVSVYICEFCGKTFKSSTRLWSHRKVHSKDRPHVCNVCNKGFKIKAHLRIHLRVHSGDKPFVCDVCGKGYAVKWNLKTHRLIHSEKKPFQCFVCKKSFASAASLQAHMRSQAHS